MIIQYSRLDVADNSGAKIVQVIGLLGVSAKKVARVGDKIRITVKKAIPNSPVPKGSIETAVIVRTKQPVVRKDGSRVRFDQNAAVIIDEDGNPKGTRIFGAICRELRDKGYMKIVSLAPEVV
ncbi:MAG: 50S ribosomal protein L14 [Caldisericia bacterium]|nr:50S ribosomal protein L14 [Caldisericia bacterium]